MLVRRWACAVAFHIAGAVPEAVFDYVSDPQTVPVWQSDALSQRQLTQGPAGMGTLFDNRQAVARVPIHHGDGGHGVRAADPIRIPR